MRKMKKVISVILLITMMVTLNNPSKSNIVDAATTNTTVNYITIQEFVKKLVIAMELEVDRSKNMPYITAAYNNGILVSGDFNSFDDKITRTDAAVLLNRADIYLNGESLTDEYIKVIIDKRISDISKISKNKRKAVASVYGKGIIKGYSNGKCSQDREFKGSNLVTKGTANAFINLTVNKKNRAKLSPDGQLIRTTNLPKNANKFDYILESFPNSFYEADFEWKFWNWEKEPSRYKQYFYPIDMKDTTFENFFESLSMKEQMDLYMDDWMNYMETYVNLIFNVDYRTVNDQWVQDVIAVCAPANGKPYEEFLGEYIDDMKKLKTVVKSRRISVEPSTLYESSGFLFVRVYVDFYISASSIPINQCEGLIYSDGTYVKNLKLNGWNQKYFDISFSTSKGFNGDGRYIKVNFSNLLLSTE